MPFIAREELEEVRQIDLYTYMASRESDNLVKVCVGTYRLVEHDSVVISNGLWCQKSTGIGGRSALDYLIKVRGMSLPDAVGAIRGDSGITYTQQDSLAQRKPQPKVFSMPALCCQPSRAMQYLYSRGISHNVAFYFLQSGYLGETLKYHNAVFIGYDYNSNQPQYAMLRGCGSDFKGEVYGSDKQFAFRLSTGSEVLHVFEAAIDLLSYATLLDMQGADWKSDALLSLGGIAKLKGTELPIALSTYLQHNPQTATIILHLDNDAAGRAVSQQILQRLPDGMTGIDRPPPAGKDVNDYLCAVLSM